MIICILSISKLNCVLNNYCTHYVPSSPFQKTKKSTKKYDFILIDANEYDFLEENKLENKYSFDLPL